MFATSVTESTRIFLLHLDPVLVAPLVDVGDDFMALAACSLESAPDLIAPSDHRLLGCHGDGRQLGAGPDHGGLSPSDRADRRPSVIEDEDLHDPGCHPRRSDRPRYPSWQWRQ